MSAPFIACNPAFRKVLSLADRLAPEPCPVLIVGEAGVGKEALARRIHAASRRPGPFAVLEAGRDDALLRLRGHEAGAYTGARGPRAGLIEQARGGTLFIDLLEDLPPLIQAFLEPVLDAGPLRRFGGEEERACEVRVVAAAQRPWEELRARLRPGLAFRFSAAVLELPPLRARPEDIPWLAEAALARGAGPRALTLEALDLLLAQRWPGNLRQLLSTVQAATAFAAGDEALDAPAIARALGAARPAESGFQALRRRHRQEIRGCVEAALARSGGRKGQAAASLGLSRHALRRLQERLAQSDDGL